MLWGRPGREGRKEWLGRTAAPSGQAGDGTFPQVTPHTIVQLKHLQGLCTPYTVYKMSRRDLQAFVTTYRSSDIDNLVVRAKNGLKSSKYKPVDYKQLHAITEAKKLESANILFKIKKAEQASRINKEQSLLKWHGQVWWQEHKRLHESRQKLELEIQALFDEESECSLDLWDLKYELSKELNSFQENTVQPIWQLREDLKYRLSEMQTNREQQPSPEYQFNLDEVIEEVEFVKMQQKIILEKLQHERAALERELEDCTNDIQIYSLEEKNALFHEIPPQLVSLECPYPDLKESVFAEFHKLASGYWLKLQEVDKDLKVILSNFQWNEEDLWVFQVVVGQYPSNLQGRRTLYLDMLQKLLPHKSRPNVVAHEKAWDHYHFTRCQWRTLMQNWLQARKAFLLKAVMTITEACTAHETEIMLANNRRQQQKICADLKEKVLQWRLQQEEAARLEAAIAARRKEEEDEKERFQKEKEIRQRAADKEKVKRYWAEKQHKWKEQEAKDLLRLAEFKKLMAEQALKDKESISMSAEYSEADNTTGPNLDTDAVAIVAEFDPARMMADTVASKARMGIGTEDEFFLHRPLFELHTFSAEQIISDARVRVELALREAGLHNTLYAHEILPKIPPPRLPRRDMESTVFKM